MRLVTAFFAKYADTLRDDTVAVIGGCFNTIMVPSLPMPVTMTVVIQVLFDPDECGREHVFRPRGVIGPNGPLTGELPSGHTFTPTIARRMRHGILSSVLHFVGVPFEVEGTYRFIFSVDDNDIGTLELDVLQG